MDEGATDGDKIGRLREGLDDGQTLLKKGLNMRKEGLDTLFTAIYVIEFLLGFGTVVRKREKDLKDYEKMGITFGKL